MNDNPFAVKPVEEQLVWIRKPQPVAPPSAPRVKYHVAPNVFVGFEQWKKDCEEVNVLCQWCYLPCANDTLVEAAPCSVPRSFELDAEGKMRIHCVGTFNSFPCMWAYIKKNLGVTPLLTSCVEHMYRDWPDERWRSDRTAKTPDTMSRVCGEGGLSVTDYVAALRSS